jgi:hypothetical protein
MASTFETGTIDPTDVAPVPADALIVPMRLAIAKGHGSALLTGLEELEEEEVRTIESEVWDRFADDPKMRLAVALRFRALLDVFRARRLKDAFLNQGFKLIARAVHEAAAQRLNTRFGFSPQKFLAARRRKR